LCAIILGVYDVHTKFHNNPSFGSEVAKFHAFMFACALFNWERIWRKRSNTVTQLIFYGCPVTACFGRKEIEVVLL
jgi:hypothetical protein